MKRFFTLIAILTIATCRLAAQEWANKNKIEAFMNELSDRGAKVAVSRVNDKYHLAKRYNVSFENKNSGFVDSICSFFDGMVRHSAESFRYESHKNGKDTITYSMVIKGYGQNEDYLLDMSRYENKSFTWTKDFAFFQKSHVFLYMNSFLIQERNFYKMLGGNSRKMYFGAKEVGLFDYTNGNGNIIYLSNYENKTEGTYYNFDISPLDSFIEGLKKELPKIQQYDVKYVHGEKESTDKSSTYYFTDYLVPEDSGRSESLGTLYCLPASSINKNTYQRILEAANHHMDTNKDQCCVLEYTANHLMINGIKSTVKLTLNHQAESSTLLVNIDKTGALYILRLETKGEYWIPRNWNKIKSSINGQIKNI